MLIKKIIIQNGKINKQDLLQTYKDFCYKYGYKPNSSTVHSIRNRKKLIKIVLNGKVIGYSYLNKNKTLYIESETNNITLYSDQ